MRWQTIIGLEIHVQLSTRTKLFSSAPNRFGDEPNTNISSVCTGQPGSLPVLNKEAVKKAVSLGCAIGSKIALTSRFDRKSYFYPDSPRNFQITQFEKPILMGGSITAEVGSDLKTFAIDRAHLEDDAGMLKHFSTFAGVDYNRAGAALIEIVSEPCIHSAEEAVAYAMALRDILLYLNVSDCNMEEGSLRIDVNISVKPENEKTLRNRIEIKNLNSFSHMQMAIDAEVKRQVQLYQLNPEASPDTVIEKATYRFDTEKKEIVMMRQKEMADDYRYFPEPDLPLLTISSEYIENIRKNLPELPREKTRRLTQELGLPPQYVETLIADLALCAYFEKALSRCSNAKALCTWIIVEFTGKFKELGTTVPASKIPPEHIAELINLIDQGKITGKIAKAVADEMILHPDKNPQKIVSENPDFKTFDDTSAIELIVDEVLANNPSSIADYQAGREKAFSFLVGQVMKATKGAASPQLVNELIQRKIKKI